jgi:hypothetical protein
MKKSLSVVKRAVGRSRKEGGVNPVSATRLPPETSASVDAWAASQDDEPSRSEAIRRLVELALSAAKPTKVARSTPSKVRAAELAAKVIEKMIDPSASADEPDQRRHRLTKGLPEFCEHRVDQPKAKGK